MNEKGGLNAEGGEKVIVPRDLTELGRHFMVDRLHIRTCRKVESLGPFSELKARKVARAIEDKDARWIADIRRATPEEVNKCE